MANAVAQALAGAAVISLILSAAALALSLQSELLEIVVAVGEVEARRACERLSLSIDGGLVSVENEGSLPAKLTYALVKSDGDTSIMRLDAEVEPGESFDFSVQGSEVLVVTALGNVFVAREDPDATGSELTPPTTVLVDLARRPAGSYLLYNGYEYMKAGATVVRATLWGSGAYLLGDRLEMVSWVNSSVVTYSIWTKSEQERIYDKDDSTYVVGDDPSLEGIYRKPAIVWDLGAKYTLFIYFKVGASNNADVAIEVSADGVNWLVVGRAWAGWNTVEVKGTYYGSFRYVRVTIWTSDADQPRARVYSVEAYPATGSIPATGAYAPATDGDHLLIFAVHVADDSTASYILWREY